MTYFHFLVITNVYNKHCTKSAFYAIEEPKGITLIVLIITITVMLILAGVAIANLTGGDGVMEQAQEKKDKTKIASEEAILGNVAIEATEKNGEITEANLRSALSKNNVEITPSGGLYRIVFKDSNNLYKMNHQGEFFYWEDMAPTDIYAKKDGTTLYLRSTKKVGYTKGTRWNESKVTKVVIEEPIAPTSCYLMFNSFSMLNEIENIENLHTENVESMEYMFYHCNQLTNLDLKYFDTSKVTTMYSMFDGCKNLQNINISNLDTSNVQYMGYMFSECNNLSNIDLSNFNTQNVNKMYAMFWKCYKIKTLDLSSFDTRLVTTMGSMFSNCTELRKIYVSNNFIINQNTNADLMFLSCNNIVGGKGTIYDEINYSKTYARIDNPPDTPGYFTLKEN